MRFHTWGMGIASAALILSVGIHLSGQSSGQTATPAVKPAAPQAAAAGKPAPARTAVRRVAAPPPSQAAFSAATQSLFELTCSECHYADDPAGGLTWLCMDPSSRWRATVTVGS